MNENIKLVEKYFNALSQGDMISLGHIFSDNIVWHQPGQGSQSGLFKGKEKVFAHLGQFMQLSQGTFQIDHLEYISSNEDMVAASIHFKAEANGKSMSMKGIDLMRIENDKIAEVWLFSEDLKAEDAFWSALSKSQAIR